VQSLHQVAEALPARGPGAVDGDELGVVGERGGDGVGLVAVPGGVELVFEFADGDFVGLRHSCIPTYKSSSVRPV
jgi:hypothetical protein